MRYLLDTHTIIWVAEDSNRLPSKMKEIIKLPGNRIYICSISLWEIAIKIYLGKLKIGLSLDELLNSMKISDFGILQIEGEYLKRLSTLPFLHKDPFDRLIISTAISENLTIITVDENIQKYNVLWIW